MTDISFWERPPETAIRGSYSGEYTITVLDPPLPGSTAELPPHDHARARAFAEAFPAVDAVLEELPPMPASEFLSAETLSDLDLITVGCWGKVTCISDPALTTYDAGHDPVAREVAALHERHPGALIVGSAQVDFGENHTQHAICLPDGRMFSASGFSCYEDSWHTDGDPHVLLNALGIDPADLDDADREDLGLEGKPHRTNWEMLGALALDHCGRKYPTGLEMSVFRVRHTEFYTAMMEEMSEW
ncbi:DUF6333 family protein [Streptomyces sp. NPDC101150]|uniref:DUF6333 family protein n=1 Tax=Streptomyces sp. NPDC101150 TaxID=3366114 RepID=UPI00382E0B45